MTLPRLGIRSRIHGGFGVLVALALALALFAVWQLWSIRTDVGSMSVLAENINTVHAMTSSFEIARRATLRFRFDGAEASIQEGTAAVAAGVQALDVAIARTPSEERRKLYISLKAELASYQQNRETLVTLVKQVESGRAKLASVGDKLVAETDRLVQAIRANGDRTAMVAAGNVETALLLMRIASLSR